MLDEILKVYKPILELESKIEKLLQRIAKVSSSQSVEKVCKDTVFDALRYSLLVKYQYKKRILGKSSGNTKIKNRR